MNPDDIVCSIPECDPLKRLTIPWGDLIAARNAVAQLVLALKERFPR